MGHPRPLEPCPFKGTKAIGMGHPRPLEPSVTVRRWSGATCGTSEGCMLLLSSHSLDSSSFT